MSSRSKSFNRRRPRRLERARLLVVTEGTNTEVQYLQGLVQFLRTTGISVRGVRPKGVGRDPLKVLQAALSPDGEDPNEFDEIWVVVDVDDHGTLDEALKQASSESIPMVISNPCFEIWLLWHYEDCTAHQDAKKLRARLAQHGHDDKNIPLKFPYAAHEAAVRRAEMCKVPHTFKGPNPSSAMPELVTALVLRK